ncbi:MAG: hypothetical protein ACXADF_14975 [Candidatus Thorarchaeota archaeon]|jgi:hypothetical protein
MDSKNWNLLHRVPGYPWANKLCESKYDAVTEAWNIRKRVPDIEIRLYAKIDGRWEKLAIEL